MPPNRSDGWIDEDEYPNDRDVADFGDDSPSDNHPLTIGRVPGVRPQIWTPGRVLLAVIALLIVAAMVLPLIAPLLR